MFIYDISKVATQLESKSNLNSLGSCTMDNAEINSPYVIQKGKLTLSGISPRGRAYQCLLQEGSVILIRENKDYKSENKLVDRAIARCSHLVEIHTAIVYTTGINGKRKPHVQSQKSVYVNLAELKKHTNIAVSDLYDLKVDNNRILKILKSSLV